MSNLSFSGVDLDMKLKQTNLNWKIKSLWTNISEDFAVLFSTLMENFPSCIFFCLLLFHKTINK